MRQGDLLDAAFERRTQRTRRPRPAVAARDDVGHAAPARLDRCGPRRARTRRARQTRCRRRRPAARGRVSVALHGQRAGVCRHRPDGGDHQATRWHRRQQAGERRAAARRPRTRTLEPPPGRSRRCARAAAFASALGRRAVGGAVGTRRTSSSCSSRNNEESTITVRPYGVVREQLAAMLEGAGVETADVPLRARFDSTRRRRRAHRTWARSSRGCCTCRIRRPRW